MTVYELIQELSQYDADTKVVFHVEAEFDAVGDAEFDRNKEDDMQEVTVSAEFDEDVSFDEIIDNEGRRYHPNITINLVY